MSEVIAVIVAVIAMIFSGVVTRLGMKQFKAELKVSQKELGISGDAKELLSKQRTG